MIKGIGKGIGKKKKGLTPKQVKFLAEIKEFISKNGYSPSYEEIKQMTNMRSKSNVHAYVQELKKRGYVDFLPAHSRTLRVL